MYSVMNTNLYSAGVKYIG